MATAASLAKVINYKKPIKLNYAYSEYMNPWFFKSCPINKLSVHKKKEHELHRDVQLHGAKFIGCENGKKEALKIFPEEKTHGIERVRRNIKQMQEHFDS